MKKGARFLLIGGSRDPSWRGVLATALRPLGTLKEGKESEAIERLRDTSYQLIIVDAAVVRDAPSFVTRIREHTPDARVVIATASPTWRRARDAFRAGVVDYIPKTLDEEEIRELLERALAKTPPRPSAH